MMDDSLKTEEDVLALVQRMANEVYDPCGMARGLELGMVDMGLIRDINVQPKENGWDVSLRIRFTSPGCLYFLYFEREIRHRLEAFPQIEVLHIEWDDVCDWTPEDLSEAAQSKFKEHNEKLLEAALRQQR
ncbi:MAG TPA: hypothetical protein V6D48_04380 [Oculatellaceae cyanobacterium]